MTAPLLAALLGRRLYKRALECPAAELASGAAEWIATDPALVVAVEDFIAKRAGLAPGEVLLDYPTKTQMLGLDIPVLRRSGVVERLTPENLIGSINLPSLSDELYQSARWLRVFVARRTTLPAADVLGLLSRPASDVRAAISD